MYKRPIKIFWQSEFIVHTGFSTAAMNICDRLYELGRDQGMPKYEIFVQGLAYRRHPFDDQPNPRPYKVFPMTGQADRYIFGQDMAASLIQSVRPDIIIPFGDLWMVEHFVDNGCVPEDLRRGVKVMPYLPIDGAPIPQLWNEKFKRFDHVVFYSKFGYNQALQANPGLSASMIYHGVNSMLFRPLHENHVENFKKGHGFQGKFIVGMVARNQARKNHPQLLKAFAKFSEGKSDTVLLLNCCAQDQGWDLNDLINRFGLHGKAFITNPTNNPAFGMPTEHLVMLYNAMDVHVLATSGEGFGIPILEAMSCGTPVLTDGYAAGKELVEDSGGGMLLDSEVEMMRGSDHNFQRSQTSVEDLAKKLQWMYDHKQEREEMGRKARAYALNMSWDKFAYQWDETITQVLEGRNASLNVEVL